MRKLNLFQICLLLLGIGFFASCDKDDAPDAAATAPSITIDALTSDSLYTLGERTVTLKLEAGAGFKAIEVVPSSGTATVSTKPDEGDRTGDAAFLYTAPETAGNATITVKVTDLEDTEVTETVTLRVVKGNLSIDAASLKIIPFHTEGKGSIDITPIAGAAPFTFLWSNGATTEDVSDLDPGSYTVTITDKNGQTFVSEPFVIEDAGVIMIDGDGNVYRTIEYGGYYWIDRDLQSNSDGNGTAITTKLHSFGSDDPLYEVIIDLEKVVFEVQNMVIDSLSINEEAVYYYTLAAAAEVCPEGWTLPWKKDMDAAFPVIIMPTSPSWSGYGIPTALFPGAADSTAFNLGGIENGEFNHVGNERKYWGAYLDDGSGNLNNGTVFYNTNNNNGNIYNLFASNEFKTDDAIGAYSYWGSKNRNAYCVRCVKKK